MKKYIGKRIMISLVTLLIIILVLFMLLQLMPGSPFNDEKLTADQIAMMSKKYGLDKPLIVQFFTYVKEPAAGRFWCIVCYLQGYLHLGSVKEPCAGQLWNRTGGSFLRCGSRTDFRYSGSAQEKQLA